VIRERQRVIDELHRELFSAEAGASGNVSRPAEPVDLDDQTLLDRAMAATNGGKFRALWTGDTSGYTSASEADAALAFLLAFWSGRDVVRMDALFRRSGLMRPKWDARRGDTTYGAQTLARAVEQCSETYQARRGSTNGSSKPASANDERPARRRAVIVNAATITPETVEWLWPGRIARRALSNCVGLPDQGKTLLFCDVTARLTTGAPMPPEPRTRRGANAQRVLILSLEDSWSTTLVPRLLRAGADLERVDFLKMVQDADGQTSILTLADDLDALAAALAGGRYALVIVDGITGYLGNAKTHNDADVRRVLAPFAEMLDREQVAGLSVMHPPKAITNLAYYAGGSVAFTAIPRVTLGVAPDPHDESASPRRLLMKIKGNLYGPVPSLAYRIVADGPAAVPAIEWEPEPVTVNVAEVLDPIKETPEDRGTRRSCEEWLRSYLGDGPRGSKDVERAAKAAGFSTATLRRARERVVDTVKTGAPGRVQAWEWALR
jgi:putative DNA primase/helicase